MNVLKHERERYVRFHANRCSVREVCIVGRAICDVSSQVLRVRIGVGGVSTDSPANASRSSDRR